MAERTIVNVQLLDDAATIICDLLDGCQPKELHRDPLAVVSDLKAATVPEIGESTP